MFRVLYVFCTQLLQHLRLRKLEMDSFSFVASPGAFPKDPPARAISSNLKSPPVGDDLVGPVIRLMGVSLPTSRHLARFLEAGRGGKAATRAVTWDLQEITEMGASEERDDGQRAPVDSLEREFDFWFPNDSRRFLYGYNSDGRRSGPGTGFGTANDSSETHDRRGGQDDITK